MKTHAFEIGDRRQLGTGEWRKLDLECAGKRSATPLSQFKPRRLISGVIALLLSVLISQLSTARAQSYSIGWYKIAGGGGTSTGSVYSVTGTIGQPDAGGAMSGGSFSVTGGFWSLISVVQTAGAPLLAISYAGNTVTVFWQNVSGWTLQQNANLALANNWSASSGVTTSSGTNYLNLLNPSGNWFFRLAHP